MNIITPQSCKSLIRLKRILVGACLSVILISCTDSYNNHVKISGQVSNKISDSLLILSETFKKTILLDEEGKFSTTLRVTPGSYTLFDGRSYTEMYLKSGYDLSLMVDARAFEESLRCEGKGAEVNNFLIQKRVIQKQLITDESIFNLDKKTFEKKLDAYISQIRGLFKTITDVDPSFFKVQNKRIDELKNNKTQQYNETVYRKKILAKGKPSPKFINYENSAGGTVSLNQLKGKYAYIDLWATWCRPCKVQIPYLKKIIHAYRNKNITFISISIDSPGDYRKWKDMVSEENLKGIQLIADKSFKSDFIKAYRIKGIPHFILLDPDGNIINADAPRPSSQDELTTLLDSLTSI